MTERERPVEDVLEQSRGVRDDEPVDGPVGEVPLEASDADVAEQSREVPLDDEEHDL